MKEFKPEEPTKLHATGWIAKAKHSWGAWIFVAAVIAVMVVVSVLR